MKVSFIVPCRNKAEHVGKTVDSVLAQTFEPMEIILSDQGSTDGTKEILEAKASAYSGPNLVRVLSCPDQDFIGRAGLNRHIWWILQQTDADLIIMCAADDINHPDRAKHTVDAYENAYKTHPEYVAKIQAADCIVGRPRPNPDDYRPSHIGTRMRRIEPNGKILGETNFPERRSRWVQPVECIKNLIGSSASPAWSRDLWEKYGELGPCESDDMIMPILALFDRGFYYIDKPLFTYVNHASMDNTGLEGVVRAMVAGSDEQVQAIETANYHMVSHWTNVARRLNAIGALQRVPQEFHAALAQHICSCADKWALVRDHMTVMRIEPKNMRV